MAVKMLVSYGGEFVAGETYHLPLDTADRLLERQLGQIDTAYPISAELADELQRRGRPIPGRT